MSVVPGSTRPTALNQYTVYPVPEGEEYRLPLLQSLLEIRDEHWEVVFDEEEEERVMEIEENDIVVMINEVCYS